MSTTSRHSLPARGSATSRPSLNAASLSLDGIEDLPDSDGRLSPSRSQPTVWQLDPAGEQQAQTEGASSALPSHRIERPDLAAFPSISSATGA